LTFQAAPEGGLANYQTLGALVGEPGRGSAERDRILAALHAAGVQAGKLSYALHTLPQFRAEAQAAEAAGRALTTSADIAARGLCLPLFPGMSDDQVAQVIAAVRSALRRSFSG